MSEEDDANPRPEGTGEVAAVEADQAMDGGGFHWIHRMEHEQQQLDEGEALGSTSDAQEVGDTAPTCIPEVHRPSSLGYENVFHNPQSPDALSTIRTNLWSSLCSGSSSMCDMLGSQQALLLEMGFVCSTRLGLHPVGSPGCGDSSA